MSPLATVPRRGFVAHRASEINVLFDGPLITQDNVVVCSRVTCESITCHQLLAEGFHTVCICVFDKFTILRFVRMYLWIWGKDMLRKQRIIKKRTFWIWHAKCENAYEQIRNWLSWMWLSADSFTMDKPNHRVRVTPGQTLFRWTQVRDEHR